MSNIVRLPDQEPRQDQTPDDGQQADREYHNEGRKRALLFLSGRMIEVTDPIHQEEAIGLSYILALIGNAM